VDFVTRHACFHGGDICEISRIKNPPTSTLGQRVAIERKTVTFDEKGIARMRAVAEEDRLLRNEEQVFKIEIEHELAIEALTRITKVYSDDEWQQLDRTFSLHRGFYDGIGTSDLTLGGVGVDRLPRFKPMSDEEIEDQEHATTENAANENFTETESKTTDDTEQTEFEPTESLIEIEEFEEAA
jgi:hypothetical protein